MVEEIDFTEEYPSKILSRRDVAEVPDKNIEFNCKNERVKCREVSCWGGKLNKNQMANFKFLMKGNTEGLGERSTLYRYIFFPHKFDVANHFPFGFCCVV